MAGQRQQSSRAARVARRIGQALFAGALGLAWAMPAHAEAAPPDPIDKTMQHCLARADRSSVAGQVQCTDEARGSWQLSIDNALGLIDANAGESERRAWDASQTRWVAWRKEEVRLVHAVYAATSGSASAMAEANVLLQPVRDRALTLRAVAQRYAPGVSALPGVTASAAAASAAAGSAADAGDASRRLRPCSRDAACEHAQFDLNRYLGTLRLKLPVRTRVTLARAQRTWRAYFDATAPLGTERDRVDLIGARLATLKRLSETAGND
jgi:uncharacterized protein YecT (DUF1311 family)